MNAKDCEYFDTCNAHHRKLYRPSESLSHCIWYPDENICKRGGKELFIKQQRKLKKKSKHIYTYFTYEMLNANRRLGNTRGLDPNKAEAPQLKKWLKDHPKSKKLNNEEKEEMIKRFVKSDHEKEE